MSEFATSHTANSIAAFVLSFAAVLIVGADSGGYWPTAWDWTALILLFIGAVLLVLQAEICVRPLEATLPLALLGLTAWGMVSALWNPSATEPILQSQRTLVYVAAALAALLLVQAATYGALLAGTWAAITCLSYYALLTRLFPERIGYVDTIAGQRLEAPLGYWNALSLISAMGLLLAFGFAARARHCAIRALAAASVVVLAPTLYFTFSRGGWVALGAGLIVLIALDRRRLQLLAAVAAPIVWPVVAVWRAHGYTALTHVGVSEARAEHQGHHYFLVLLVLMAAAAATGALWSVAERRIRVPNVVRLAWAALLVIVLAAALAAGVDRYGSPMTIARHTYHNLALNNAPLKNGDLNGRLFSVGLGQRIPQWKVAWHEYATHPWLGTGQGSYERYWNQDRPWNFKVKNVHNLYLETLAELGPVGLGLLAIALLVPIVGFLRARNRSLAAVALAAYVAFLVHAIVEWDWQMPAVTLAALFCGVAILAAGRREEAIRPLGTVPRAVVTGLAVVLGAFVFVGLKSNMALAAAGNDTGAGKYAQAMHAARVARFWAPWSSEPWQLLGEAQLAVGQRKAAAGSIRHAIAKDGESWELWLDLAIATNGAERRHAFAEATRLNPLGDEIVSWKATIAKGNGGK